MYVREVKEKDLFEVMQINLDNLPENYPVDFYKKIMKNDPDLFLVACNDNGIVGYVMSRRVESGIHVVSVAVKPNYRFRGIGRRLMHETFGAALRDSTPAQLFLEVRESNRSAIEFYKHLGFRDIGWIQEYYKDGEDAVVMLITLEEC